MDARLSSGPGGGGSDPARPSPAAERPHASVGYRNLASLALIGATILVLLTFRDFGISNDEEVQNTYGEKLLAYYETGFQDRSAFQYLDLYRYGGFFDLLCAVANRVSPLGVYETRRLLGGLAGLAGLAGAWKLGRRIAGERAGLLALVLLALTPSFVGHSFNNPKDAPFATAMLWTLYYLCQFVDELPAPRWSGVIKLGLSLGCALAVRAGALLAVFYLLLGLGLHLVGACRRTRSAAAVFGQAGTALGRLAPTLGIAYCVMALFWPWAIQSPLNPIRALMGFATYPIDIMTLIHGQWVVANDPPANYVPEYLLVTLPEVVLSGLVLGLALSGVHLLRLRRWDALETHGIPFFLVAVAAVFPVLFFVVFRPTVYNGMRHFLFVVPPLAVVAAASLDQAWTLVRNRSATLARLLGASLVALLAVPFWNMAKLHPYEYIYYNALAGGVRGAQGKYELDYWSNSLIEATRALAGYLRIEAGSGPVPRVYKVVVCGNELSAAYYFPPFMVLTLEPTEADFTIAFTQAECGIEFQGRKILSIERFGVPLSFVMDKRARPARTGG